MPGKIDIFGFLALSFPPLPSFSFFLYSIGFSMGNVRRASLFPTKFYRVREAFLVHCIFFTKAPPPDRLARSSTTRLLRLPPRTRRDFFPFLRSSSKTFFPPPCRNFTLLLGLSILLICMCRVRNRVFPKSFFLAMVPTSAVLIMFPSRLRYVSRSFRNPQRQCSPFLVLLFPP